MYITRVNYQSDDNDIIDCSHEESLTIPDQAFTIKQLYDMRLRGCAPNCDNPNLSAEYDEDVDINDLSEDVFNSADTIIDLEDEIDYLTEKLKTVKSKSKSKSKLDKVEKVDKTDEPSPL